MKTKIRFIRGLGFFEAVSLGIGFLVGSGIFIIPLLAARESGPFSLISWIIGGIFSILTGLCFSELSVRLPKAGGPYTYSHEAFGDFIGLVAGWAFLLGYLTMIAAETAVLAIFFNIFFPDLMGRSSSIFLAFFFMILLNFLNYRGIKIEGETEDILTIGKIIPLALFIIGGVSLIDLSNFNFSLENKDLLLTALGPSMSLVLWSFLGAEIITVPEEEIKNAKKTVPKAIMASIFITNILYMLIAFVVIGIGVGNFNNIIELAEAYMGTGMGLILKIGCSIAILSSMNAAIMGSSRIIFSMARDNLLPKKFTHENKNKIPDYAIISQIIAVTLIIFFLEDYRKAVEVSVLSILLAYFFSCLSVLKVIKKAKGHFMIFESRFIPIISSLFCIGLMVTFSSFSWMILSFSILIGILFYFFQKKVKKVF